MSALKKFGLKVRQLREKRGWSQEQLAEAADYLKPFAHVEAEVKPIRITNNRAARAEKWWHHGEKRPAIVFVHGGPARQMLPAYHYMQFYHWSYAYNQWLQSGISNYKNGRVC